jgi:hypothetical protein
MDRLYPSKAEKESVFQLLDSDLHEDIMLGIILALKCMPSSWIKHYVVKERPFLYTLDYRYCDVLYIENPERRMAIRFHNYWSTRVQPDFFGGTIPKMAKHGLTEDQIMIL